MGNFYFGCVTGQTKPECGECHELIVAESEEEARVLFEKPGRQEHIRTTCDKCQECDAYFGEREVNNGTNNPAKKPKT